MCKLFLRLLNENVWWYTYWTRRGVADIRAFKPQGESWWNVARKFHEQREKEVDQFVHKYPLDKKSYAACNYRGLIWSLLREFRCAIVDYSCSLLNCYKTEGTDEDDVVVHSARLWSNISVVYIKMAQFAKALDCVNKALACDQTINTASALK